MEDSRSFSLASDTWSPAHPRILEAVLQASSGFAPAYGEDALTQKAKEAFYALFGDDIDVFFALNGTGANIAALSACVDRGSAVVCPDTAHIHVHETAAPEKLLGLKVQPVPNHFGKLLPCDIEQVAHAQGNHHCPSPDLVSISETTECGTVYTPAEVRTICETAHRHGMTVHMDGARFANAVAALSCDPAALCRDAGVDVLCFGGTKNGFLFGEAIVFFNRALARRFPYLLKQHLQLASKNRFIAAQFREALRDGLWLAMAEHANKTALYLADGLAAFPEVDFVYPVESNMLFVKTPTSWLAPLSDWTQGDIDERGVLRFVTSFCSKRADLDDLLQKLETLRH